MNILWDYINQNNINLCRLYFGIYLITKSLLIHKWYFNFDKNHKNWLFMHIYIKKPLVDSYNIINMLLFKYDTHTHMSMHKSMYHFIYKRLKCKIDYLSFTKIHFNSLTLFCSFQSSKFQNSSIQSFVRALSTAAFEPPPPFKTTPL